MKQMPSRLVPGLAEIWVRITFDMLCVCAIPSLLSHRPKDGRPASSAKMMVEPLPPAPRWCSYELRAVFVSYQPLPLAGMGQGILAN